MSTTSHATAAGGPTTGPVGEAGAWRQLTATGRSAVAGAMVVLVTVAVVGQALAAPSRTTWLAIDAAVGLVSLVAVPWLARGAVPGTVGVVLLSSLSPAATPVAATGVLWVARWHARPAAVKVAAASAGAVLLRWVWRPTPGIEFGWWLVLVVAVHAALVAWGTMLHARHALLASLAERARRAEVEQARRVAEGRQAERDRIAREMHDVLAHRLSLLTTYAGALEFRRDAPADEARRAAAVIRAGAHQALQDLREVIGLLRDDAVEGPGARRPVPGLGDVATLVVEAREAGGVVRLRDDLDATDRTSAPPNLGRAAYRIVQEALTNARKHADGAPVEVVVSGRAGEHLEVSVVNGAPRTSTAGASVGGTGRGLVGIEERVLLAGGTLQHGPTDAGGYRVQVRLPWSP